MPPTIAAADRNESVEAIQSPAFNSSRPSRQSSCAVPRNTSQNEPWLSPMPRLAEWHLTDSAELQLYEAKEHAGHSTLTLGVLPLEPERARLVAAGLDCGPIEPADHFYIMRMRDPDGWNMNSLTTT